MDVDPLLAGRYCVGTFPCRNIDPVFCRGDVSRLFAHELAGHTYGYSYYIFGMGVERLGRTHDANVSKHYASCTRLWVLDNCNYFLGTLTKSFSRGHLHTVHE